VCPSRKPACIDIDAQALELLLRRPRVLAHLSEVSGRAGRPVALPVIFRPVPVHGLGWGSGESWSARAGEQLATAPLDVVTGRAGMWASWASLGVAWNDSKLILWEKGPEGGRKGCAPESPFQDALRPRSPPLARDGACPCPFLLASSARCPRACPL